MANDRIFNFNGPAVFNDIHDNKDCTIIIPSPTDNTKKAAGQMATKPERKSSLPKIQKKKDEKPRELMTFRKRGILKANLQLLYSQMVEDGWIDKDTKADDFLDLFSGQKSECTIIWSGTYGKGTLVNFFRVIEGYELISTPKGFTLPNILMGHFVDKEGNFLTHLENGDPPAEKAGPDMQEYINILRLNANRAGRRAKIQDDDELGYGDALNENDIESEGLSIHKR